MLKIPWNKKWTEERVKAEYAKAAKNGIVNSSDLPSGLRNHVMRVYGGHGKACELFGYKCIGNGRSTSNLKTSKDLKIRYNTQNIPEEAVVGNASEMSLCWLCKRATNPEHFRCSWAANLTFVKGATCYITKDGAIRMCSCPNYVEDNSMNRKIILDWDDEY